VLRDLCEADTGHSLVSIPNFGDWFNCGIDQSCFWYYTAANGG
jgi:hypothetical protein